LHVIQVREERGHHDERADEQAKGGKTEKLLLPMVDADEHDREGLETNVEESVDEADMEVTARHRGHRDLADRGVSGGLAEAACSAV